MKCLAKRVSPFVSSSPKELAVVNGRPGTCGSVIDGRTDISLIMGI